MALNTDTSLAQTQKIHRAQYKMAEGFSKSQETSPLDLVRQALATLKPLKVIIPYAGFLEFPAKLSRSRRDNSRMLQLIRASALLHQANRPMAVHQETETTYIKATLEDYAIAHELLQLVPSCTDNISARLIDDHKTLLQHFGCRTPISMVNVKSVKNTNLDKAKELLMELESAGLVDQYDGGARQRLYIIKDIKKYASLYGVISPDKLKSKVVSVCGEDKAADLLGISDFDKTYNKIEEFVESEEEPTETESSKPFLQVNESQTVTEVNEEDII